MPNDFDSLWGWILSPICKCEVVGHTVQPKGVNGVCDDGHGPQIWRIDVGLAKLYGGPIEVLELTPDKPPRVLKGAR